MEWSFGQNPGIEKRAWSMRSQESKGSEALIISLCWVEFFFQDRKQLKIMLQESEESVVESFCWADQTVRISQCWVILSFWKNELAGKCGVHGPLTSGSQKSKNKSKNLLSTAGCLPVLSGNPLERTGGLPARKHLLEYISDPLLFRLQCLITKKLLYMLWDNSTMNFTPFRTPNVLYSLTALPTKWFTKKPSSHMAKKVVAPNSKHHMLAITKNHFLCEWPLWVFFILEVGFWISVINLPYIHGAGIVIVFSC